MSTFKRISIVILLSAVIFIQGCAVLPFKRDFSKIFSTYLPRVDDNPVIIVPGIIGSRLVNTETGKMLWGSLRLKQILFLSERDGIALPIESEILSENRDSIASKGIIDMYELPTGIIQFNVYIELLEMFEEIGYRLGDIKNPKPEDNLYIFDYDWRRDNVETAGILDETIENLKAKRGRPNEKFTLICHSMGGLIGRYYARYGGKDVLSQAPNFKVTCAGSKNLKRLILLSVPSLGSLPIFQFLHKGLDLTIAEYPPYVLYTMPSVYQLLPFREVHSFITGEGDEVYIDLYNIENWKRYGWSIYSDKMKTLMKSRYKLKYREGWEEQFGKYEKKRDRFVASALKRADLFQKSLNFRPQKRSACEVILFGGDTNWTISKAVLKKENGGWKTYFWDPRLKEKILKPGDTMITRDSLLGVINAGVTKKVWEHSPMDIAFSLFVTQRHENIHKDATFQNNLLHILLGD
ncbi:MAG: hypothetical protein HQ575_07330 [Candidatus Omnitrophica bacterium]|nr:hypothetical protein [Candidatus Omnitrophota bacterium]